MRIHALPQITQSSRDPWMTGVPVAGWRNATSKAQ